MAGQPVAALAQTPVKCPGTAPTEAAAAKAAVACHGRVEVASARDERTQVFANATGSFTSQTAVEVQRVRNAAGTWVKPDTTLKASGGRVVPSATSMALSFSGGGTGPVVTLGKGAAELSLTWPTALPAPKLDGDDVTYPEVLPGVDLVFTAHVTTYRYADTTPNDPTTGQPHALRSTTKKDSSGSKTVTYSYDKGGNTKTRPGPNGTQSLVWDAEAPCSRSPTRPAASATCTTLTATG
ncbi:hypothetical protein [Actinoplanes sp. NPDC048796]|uniref:hypothetical protein n=1 Tax=unclassified Actinoplanes TaxID=2626549 RepID=UPI0033C1F3DF